MASNDERIASWRRIRTPEAALKAIVDNWFVIGNDPYYSELNDALCDMACRVHNANKARDGRKKPAT